MNSQEVADRQVREQIEAQEARDLAEHANEPRLTVVVYRRRETDPFEARVLQEHRLGPNLSPKTGTAEMARSAATRRLRLDGYNGSIVFQEGFPESVKIPAFDQSPVSNRRGLRRPKSSPAGDLFPQC